MTSHEKQAAKGGKAQRTPTGGADAQNKGSRQQGGKTANQRRTGDGGSRERAKRNTAASGAPRGAAGGAGGKAGVPHKRGGGARGAYGSEGRVGQQPSGKSAIVLSAAVFVLCMACLAAGFYLSAYTEQDSDPTIDTAQHTAREARALTQQESHTPPVVATPIDDTALLSSPLEPTAAGSAQDVGVQKESDTIVPEEGDWEDEETLAHDVSLVVPPVVPDDAQGEAMVRGHVASDGVNHESTNVQEASSSVPVEAHEGEGFAIPPARGAAVLVFIIDDGGYSTVHIEKYTSLPFPVAVAVLPRLAHSVECAQIVRSSGQELMLHQPMQAKNLNLYPGEGAVLPGMSADEIYDTVVENLREIAPVRGMNNHEGSLITADADKVAAVLEATKDAGVYFLDSRTSADTVAPQVAAGKGMRILQRDVFIDDVISEDEMLKQILRGLDIANKKGQAVMIGHVDKSAAILPSLLRRMYPELVKQGYTFAFPSELLH